MRIRNGYEVKNISGQDIIVLNGEPLKNNIVLNDSSLFLWNLVKEKDVNKSQMLEALLANSQISTVLALGDIDIFVRTLKEYGILEE